MNKNNINATNTVDYTSQKPLISYFRNNSEWMRWFLSKVLKEIIVSAPFTTHIQCALLSFLSILLYARFVVMEEWPNGCVYIKLFPHSLLRIRFYCCHHCARVFSVIDRIPMQEFPRVRLNFHEIVALVDMQLKTSQFGKWIFMFAWNGTFTDAK